MGLSPDQIASAKAALMATVPSVAFTPNGKQEEFLRLVGTPQGVGTQFFMLLGGNGLGKTTTDGNLLAAIIYGKDAANPWFGDCEMFRNWPFEKRAFILAEPASLEKGAITGMFKKWMIPRTYTALKGSQKYESEFHFPAYGWTVMAYSFDQDPAKLAGDTIGLLLFDEPIPTGLWGEVVARLRGTGMVVGSMTPLNAAPYIHEKYEEKPDDWHFVKGHVEDACKIHGVRGHMTHEQVESMMKNYPEEEREARATGDFMTYSGRIYRNWGDANLVDHGRDKVMADVLYAEDPPTIYQVFDPHDVRPYATTWWAAYRDGRIICFMEWPDESMKPFHELTQFDYSFGQYIQMFKRKEGKISVYRRIGDKDFMNQKRQRSGGMTGIAEELVKAAKGRVKIVPSMGDWSQNHMLVQNLLTPQKYGESDELRPRLFADRGCRNFDYAMRRYLWVKNAGKALDSKDRIASRPQERHKCFPNTVEMLMSWNPRWVAPEKWLLVPEKRERELAGAGGRSYTGYGY